MDDRLLGNSNMDNGPLLAIENLTTVYPTARGPVEAVNAINLTLERGQVLGLVGESGCGKSTVLLSILRLIRPPGRVASGSIRFRGRDVLGLSPAALRELRGREVAMIFQDPLSTLNPVFPIGEQIREALELHHIMNGGRRGWPSRDRRRRERARVLEVMEEVGIASPDQRYAAYPHQFSGGMQQRALIAIALACSPALLLADEPTTALDVTIQAQILDLMRRINREHGTAIILVTHDLAVAAEFCDTIAVMYAGRIVEQGSVDQVITAPRHPYTRGLLNCRPTLTVPRQPIAPIPGNVPDLAGLPAGCAFAPRCAEVRTACAEGPVPMLATVDEPGHASRCLAHIDYRRDPAWSWADQVLHPGQPEISDNGREGR